MERKMLQPEQIIISGDYELGNNKILQIYFRIYDRGHREDIPPVIVINKNKIRPSYVREKLQYMIATDLYQKIMSSKAEYLLLDGNHRSVAATLYHNPIDSLEIQVTKDINLAKKMVKQGELFDFPHEEKSLTALAHAFFSHIVFHADEIMTLRERVDKFTSKGIVPHYMKEKYLRGK
jgi:hypothetical protein